jgi:trimeric autotransporter adhesin
VVGYFESGTFNRDGLYANVTALHDPHGVAVDTSDNMYIADTSNYQIRMVTKSTGKVTALAGNGTSGYSGDGGLATLAVLNKPYGVAVDTAGNIYIADTYNHCIRMITKSTGIITTVAGDGTPGYWVDDISQTRQPVWYSCGCIRKCLCG